MSTWIEYNFNNTELNETAKKLGYNKPLHITLVHFPRNIIQTEVDRVKRAIDYWIDAFPKQFYAYTAGDLTIFDNGAIVQPYTVPRRIQDQRLILLYDLYHHGIRFSNNYDWNPHVTLGLSTNEALNTWKNLFIMEPELKIIGVTLHSNFGGPFRWYLKP